MRSSGCNGGAMERGRGMIDRMSFWTLLAISIPLWLLNIGVAIITYGDGHPIWMFDIFAALLLAATIIRAWQSWRGLKKVEWALEESQRKFNEAMGEVYDLVSRKN